MLAGAKIRIKSAYKTARDYATYYIAPIRNNPRKAAKCAVLGVIVCFLVLVLIAKLSGERYASQIQTSRGQLQKIQDQINAFTPPKDIEIGQQDLSVDYVIEQTDPRKTKVASVSLPSKVLIGIHLFPELPKKYDSSGQIASLRKSMQELIEYQHSVFSALEPVLEYNPRAEFADKTMNDNAIKLRISNARKGLSDTAIALRTTSSNSFPDSDKPAILKSVQTLQHNLDSFDKTRDTEIWATSVEAEQKKILSNRQQLWKVRTNQLFAEISEINQKLSEIESALRS